MKIEDGVTQSGAKKQKRGYAGLDANQADALIRGNVAQSDRTLRLWFLSPECSTLKPEARPFYTLEKTEPKDRRSFRAHYSIHTKGGFQRSAKLNESCDDLG